MNRHEVLLEGAGGGRSGLPEDDLTKDGTIASGRNGQPQKRYFPPICCMSPPTGLAQCVRHNIATRITGNTAKALGSPHGMANLCS